jgi:hypothetical protein
LKGLVKDESANEFVLLKVKFYLWWLWFCEEVIAPNVKFDASIVDKFLKFIQTKVFPYLDSFGQCPISKIL